MEWQAPGIVLAAAPHGEGHAVVTVFTAAEGVVRGLARGGGSRGQAALWQVGNVVQVRWTARLADQLGHFSAELVHPAAALAMDDALGLAILAGACGVAAGALPEREAHAPVFRDLMVLIAQLGDAEASLAVLVRWEAALLSSLGYGLDLSACAVSGARGDLAFVSPRTGRAVTAAAAGAWRSRLLPLPGFLLGTTAPDVGQCRDGLRLTGHFLERDAFGQHNRPLPAPRRMLFDRVCRMAENLPSSGGTPATSPAVDAS